MPPTNAPAARWPTDQIRVDTAKAPWMDIALGELGKGIRELAANDRFLSDMRYALVMQRQLAQSTLQIEQLSTREPSPGAGRALTLGVKSPGLVDPTPKLLAGWESQRLRERNPEIDKYFEGLKTDPAYNAKQRSFDIGATIEQGDRASITAWCAAFVNWCLAQADAPKLGFATAKSWLDFGTPLPDPVYGCITVVRPGRATGSTTGHVAFYCRTQGSRIELLGGNQGDAVTKSMFAADNVLGYRWPTRFNHYLATGSVLV